MYPAAVAGRLKKKRKRNGREKKERKKERKRQEECACVSKIFSYSSLQFLPGESEFDLWEQGRSRVLKCGVSVCGFCQCTHPHTHTHVLLVTLLECVDGSSGKFPARNFMHSATAPTAVVRGLHSVLVVVLYVLLSFDH